MRHTTLRMNTLPAGLATLGLLLGALATIPTLGGATTPAPFAFGMDAASVGAQVAAGVKPEYGTFWIGPWTLTSGWGGPDAELDRMKAAGVTPAIHFYYWGDDISKACVEDGCWSSLHNAQKDRAHWDTLAEQLVAHLDARMAGKPVLVFVESEFNKGNVATYEPLDGYLAQKAQQIRAGYANATVVMALGNWNSAAWGTFDRFAAASDMVGIQGMRGSTRDSDAHYEDIYDQTLTGAQLLKAKFGKPVILTDIALSSYPESGYTQRQADNLQRFFTGMPELQAAGVTAMIYRSWLDSPNMDLANYYGAAERHWGLATATGTKPAGDVWVAGVLAARSAPPEGTPSQSGPAIANVPAVDAADPPAQSPASTAPQAPTPEAHPIPEAPAAIDASEEVPSVASQGLSANLAQDSGPIPQGAAPMPAPGQGALSRFAPVAGLAMALLGAASLIAAIFRTGRQTPRASE